MNLLALLILSALTILPGQLSAQQKRVVKRTQTTQVRKLSQQNSVTRRTPAQFAGPFATVSQRTPRLADGEATTIYGTVIYSDGWSGGPDYGVFSFPAQANTTLTKAFGFSTYTNSSSGAAVLWNGRYYVQQAVDYGYGISEVSVQVYDVEDGEQIDELSVYADFFSADQTVDPLTNTIYAITASYSGDSELATIDYDNDVRTAIGTLTKELVALAADGNGSLFGIGADGNLYKVNKTNATLTLVGATGVHPNYMQSATVDLATGKLYWATTLNNDIANLYEVDTTTGAATLISRFPYDDELIGLYTLSKLSADAAPAAATDLTVTFEGAATTGTVSFTLPTTTNAGDALTGSLSYSINVNGEAVKTGSAAPGAAVSESITVSGGLTQITVVASNEAGKGLPAATELWVGYDAPSAPQNVSASASGNNVTLTWRAPAGSLHGGVLNTEAINYSVTRYPGAVSVATGLTATSFSETIPEGELTAYYYVVTAFAGELEGESAQSGNIILGNAIVPPYSQTFDDPASMALLNVFSGSRRGGSRWQYPVNGAAYVQGDNWDGSNEYIATPKLQLDSKYAYRLSARIWSEWAANYPYTVSGYVGNDLTANAMTTEIFTLSSIRVPDEQTPSGLFTVPSDGEYYVAIRNYSYGEMVYLDDILVEQGPLAAAPAAATNLKAVADATGAGTVVLTFNAPQTTVAGQPVGAMQKLYVQRDGEQIFESTAPSANHAYTITDKKAVVGGWNTYTVQATNAAGEGDIAEVKVWVGADAPTEPINIKVKAVDGTKAQITWDAPEVGQNGGYVDAASLSYAIARFEGNGGQNFSVLSTTLTETSFEEDIPQEGEQDWLYYGVQTANELGYSGIGYSNTIIKGAPYQLPYTESFAGGQRSSFWGSELFNDRGWGRTWYPSTGSPYDGDGGNMEFGGSGYDFSGAKLFSGKISLVGAKNPILEAAIHYRAENWSNPDASQPLQVGIIKNSADTVIIKEILPTPSYVIEYTFYRLPLTDFIGADHIQLLFIAGNNEWEAAYIDAIEVRDLYDNDLTAIVSAPATAQPDSHITANVTVKNIGTKVAQNFSVELYDGDRLLGLQQGTSVEADQTAAFSFDVPVNASADKLQLKAVVNYGLDENPDNNASKVATVVVNVNNYPAPTAAVGEQTNDNTVVLTWTAPEFSDFAVATVESAEDYEPWVRADSFGEWTVVDRDQLPTHNDIQAGDVVVDYEDIGGKHSWLVFDPVSRNYPTTSYSWWNGEEPTGYQPISGNKFFASISVAQYDENWNYIDGQNDDWLISPELTGEAQTISFYAHGYSGYNSFEVLYSTTDNNPDSFTSLDSYPRSTNWDNTWGAYSYDLPAGAKYFAIRNVSYNYSYRLFVDDITFTAESGKGALTLTGYNIYRDGELIKQIGAEETTYTDALSAVGDHTYAITAIYNLGESGSVAAEVTVATGISAAELLDRAAISEIYSLDGRRLSSLQRGVNIVRLQNGIIRKVNVK
ncbi:MAG: choice-of-anchor J domain-containing protein [Prevotella sp.]|nr:choice-of-anchor J domain-containing protein [Prevotella sp.]